MGTIGFDYFGTCIMRISNKKKTTVTKKES